ncbi:MAG: LPS export ABC transporter periplasmic protein LptC [Oxalobacter sp.]|nr:LPS export ABC transporter periplasmic protein LptC [Oxalobacter sp.]
MNPGTKSTMLKQGLIVLIIAIILALGSMWVNMVLKKTAYKDLPEEERTDPDYMIENFRFFRFLPDGTPRYEAIGKKLTHYPAEDAYKIENPVIHLRNSKGQLQTVKADEAFAEDFNTKIHLTNNVRLVEEGSEGKAPRILTTEYLLYYPDDEVSVTDREVTIRQGKNSLKGIGMKSNSATQELEMRGRVHLTIYPDGDKAAKPKDKENNPQPAGTSATTPDNRQQPDRVNVQLN